MRFYYISLFSLAAYIVVATIAIVLLSLVWTRLLKLRPTNPAYWLLIAAILVGPWAEELSIAYNFDQFCRKDAGLFIHKVVQVDGFYDDTGHWWRQLAESNYKFVESKDYIYKTLWRVERDGSEIRHFRIDKPTARYEYKRVDDHTPVGNSIERFENIVLDRRTGEVLGRYTDYTRGPYWFFIALDAPRMQCREVKGKDPISYRAVLKPGK